MKKVFFGLILGALLITLIGCVGPAQKTSTGLTQAQIDLQMGMRTLWEDHITWTRVVIISLVDDLGDKDAAVARLLKNQEDIGNAIKPFYGDAAGNKLTELLKEHINTAAALIIAAKKGDAKAADDAEKAWYKNADDIAAFLSGANPNWSQQALKDMLYDHLKYTKTEAVARLTKDYQGDVAAYDTVHKQALSMADGLSAGIVIQFPDKFGK